MKTNEVPQDKAYFEEGKIRDVCYAVDENGICLPENLVYLKKRMI